MALRTSEKLEEESKTSTWGQAWEVGEYVRLNQICSVQQILKVLSPSVQDLLFVLKEGGAVC